MKRLSVVITSCAVLGLLAPGQASALRLSWPGLGRARLGSPIAAAAGALGDSVGNGCGRQLLSVGGVVLDDQGSPGRVADIRATGRGVTGPRGVRVGMGDRALRAALGRRSAAFRARGRHGRLLMGPKGHTVWALDASAHARSVGEFGVAIDKSTARRAASAGPCAALVTTPAATTGPAAGPASTPPHCPAALPSVGPYMRVACDESTGNQVRFTCHPDWLDSDGNPADGCEAEKSGLQTMWFQQWSAASLADHILGGFSMDGYAAEAAELTTTDWGWSQGPSPTVVEVPPDCSSNPTVACPGGQPAEPPPRLDLDFTMQPGDSARSVVQSTGTAYPTGSTFLGAGMGTEQATAVARFRLTTESPIPFTYSGTSCQVSIDSTQGGVPDFALEATLSRAIDVNTGQGEDGPPQLSNISLSGLEGADYAVEGGIACALASIPAQAIADTIQPALTNWYSAATHLCATTGPYWWQPCPPSVQVSW